LKFFADQLTRAASFTGTMEQILNGPLYVVLETRFHS